MATLLSDTDLLDGLKRGDSAAFRQVHVQHFGMIRYLILNNNGREEDARDVFQEAQVVLFEQLQSGKFEQKASLKTWLYAVCRNKWLKRLEKEKRQVRITDFEAVEPFDDTTDLDAKNEQHEVLRRSLDMLGNSCKKLLLLFYFFQKSMEEIAEDLNYTNADTAKTQKYKCLQRLKALYKTREQAL
ncbi:MAG: RNA polymerase sigma factor [Bacteroidia bacterium]